MRKTEVSQGVPLLPACLTTLALLVATGIAPVRAQESYRVVRTENFRQQPASNASRLALVLQNTVMRAIGSRGQWRQLDLEGWIWSRSVGRVNDADFDLRVTASPTENLRDAPNGEVLARLSTGTLLQEIERQGNWVRVHRTAWMYGQSLAAVETDSPSAPAVTQPTRQGQPDANRAVSLDAAILAPDAEVVDVPEGGARARVASETPVRIMARSGEWVRVQLEGWVRESDLLPADDGVLVGVTGDEVRANPGIYEGQLVQWTLLYISVRVADELRRDLPEGSPYILARGPIPEAGFVYGILNPSQVQELEALPELTELVVIGRVQRGLSDQLGNPIIEVVDLSVREQ